MWGKPQTIIKATASPWCTKTLKSWARFNLSFKLLVLGILTHQKDPMWTATSKTIEAALPKWFTSFSPNARYNNSGINVCPARFWSYFSLFSYSHILHFWNGNVYPMPFHWVLRKSLESYSYGSQLRICWCLRTHWGFWKRLELLKLWGKVYSVFGYMQNSCFMLGRLIMLGLFEGFNRFK